MSRTFIERLCNQIDAVEEDWHAAERRAVQYAAERDRLLALRSAAQSGGDRAEAIEAAITRAWNLGNSTGHIYPKGGENPAVRDHDVEKCIALALPSRGVVEDDELGELQVTFDLMHAAHVRGIEMFKAAHPDYPELRWPSTDDLFCWIAADRDETLLALDAARTEAKTLKAIGTAVFPDERGEVEEARRALFRCVARTVKRTRDADIGRWYEVEGYYDALLAAEGEGE